VVDSPFLTTYPALSMVSQLKRSGYALFYWEIFKLFRATSAENGRGKPGQVQRSEDESSESYFPKVDGSSKNSELASSLRYCRANLQNCAATCLRAFSEWCRPDLCMVSHPSAEKTERMGHWSLLQKL